MKRLLASSAVMAFSAVVLAAPAPSQALMPAAVTRTPAGNFHPVSPQRVVDTRSAGGMVHAGQVVTVPVTGQGAIPAGGVQAVVVNLTAVDPASSGWFTAYPFGGTVPQTSTLNFRSARTGAVTATIPVGADGKIAVRGGRGSANLLVDVIGWYSSATSTATGGTLLNPQDPYRSIDTRAGGGAIPVRRTAINEFSFYDGSGSRLKAVVANITAIPTSGSGGYLTAWSGAGTRPGTSTLNYAPGEVSPNTTTIPVVYNRTDALGNSWYRYAITPGGHGSVNVIVDIAGYYTTAADGVGAVFVPLSPTRLADTRTGAGGVSGKRGTNSTTNLLLPSTLVSLSRTQAFAGNLTATGATKSTYQTIWSGTAPTDSSTTNVEPGYDRANGALVLTMLNDNATRLRYAVFNRTASADFVVDITGRFDTSPDQPAAAPKKSAKRIVSSRTYLVPAKGSSGDRSE